MSAIAKRAHARLSLLAEATGRLAKCERLIERWRKQADLAELNIYAHNEHTLRDCADQLEAALHGSRRSAEPPAPVLYSTRRRPRP